MRVRFHERMAKAHTLAGVPVTAAYLGFTVARALGVHNPLTLHFSNFAHGLVMMGIAHNLLAASAPRWRRASLWITLAAMTAANALIELTPYTRYSPGSPDWADFTAGMLAVVAYYAAAMALQGRRDARDGNPRAPERVRPRF